jgi:hypothetical protein
MRISCGAAVPQRFLRGRSRAASFSRVGHDGTTGSDSQRRKLRCGSVKTGDRVKTDRRDTEKLARW